VRSRFIELIHREVEHHLAGRPAGIFAKANSLTDTVLIDEFYQASRAGLPIDLLIRGICCLKPGLKGQSETIRVGSIVGRFLEHSRVYRFLNGGAEEIYLSSADLMSRNLDNRLEVMCPIEDASIKERVRREAIDLAFADTVKLRWLGPDGRYVRAEPSDGPIDSQSSLMRV
jgi:polyphosphate kinase